MLSATLEALIEERLDDVLSGRVSQRALAQELGISRGILAEIIHGRRPIDRSRRLGAPEGPVRCPGCGGLLVVKMPCICCRDRAELAGRPAPEPRAPSPEPLTVALQDEDAERYLQLQARRSILQEAQQLADDDPFGNIEPTDAELRAIETDQAEVTQ